MEESQSRKNIFAVDALENTTTVIVGGSSGIGLATAHQIVSTGGKVIILGRSQEKIDAAKQELGGKATGMSVDCSNEDCVKAAFENIK